jgi:long-chain fatty acid transport protein
MKKINVLIAVLCSGASLTASAAGFALIEQSASGMGNAFAGGSAAAEDASTIFFNPAGMTYLPDDQLVVSGHAIRPSATFTNNGSHSAAGAATPGGNGGDAGDWSLVPNMYFSKSITPDIKLGLGISAPFGLQTSYDPGWVGRYQALQSELYTININPSIAFKATDRLSLGFGVSAMRAEAKLTNAVDVGSILGGGLNQNFDGLAHLKGDDWGIGWNAGAIFQFNDSTRFGLAYRSEVHEKLEGNVNFTFQPGTPGGVSTALHNGAVNASLTLPDSLSASLFHQLNDQWDIMADVTWTGWSSFKTLTATYSTGAALSSTPENWKNTVRVSAGATYHYSDALRLRGGIAYDESPVPDAFRTPRIPDNDRTWLAFGASYKITPAADVDVGYTHIFVKNTSINKTTDTSFAQAQDTVIGSYDSDVNIVSLQLTYNF